VPPQRHATGCVLYLRETLCDAAIPYVGSEDDLVKALESLDLRAVQSARAAAVRPQSRCSPETAASATARLVEENVRSRRNEHMPAMINAVRSSGNDQLGL
jgi:hypothetical protein